MGTNATNPKEVSSDVPLSKSGETATNLNGASKGNGNGKDKTATAETQTGKPSAGSSAANRKPKPRCRSLGPVANLEEHVPSDWWRRVFNAYYLKTDGDVVEDESITKDEVSQFIQVLGTPPQDAMILDLCCGQGRHTLELARRGYKNVHGVDRSHYLIQKAKTRARKEGLSAKFREGDARKIDFPADTFDFILILGNSFGYFDTTADDLRVLKEVFRILKPWGKILIDVTDGTYIKSTYDPRSWEWIGDKYFVCRERSLSLDNQRLISREIITHVEKGVLEDQFYAERLYDKETLQSLFNTAKFSDTVFHGTITPDSQRNQDLGMMAQRLIVTAQVKKEWTPVKPKTAKPQIRSIAVILGDPQKKDPIKPGAVFDDDDIYTIDQLKSALKNADNYNVTYLTNHNTLISDLVKLEGKIDYVFNLCDEGYNNEARKELHVPSLLEILNIPYTGGGPQCLAYCYDKSLVRGIAAEMEIPVPPAFFIKPEDTTFEFLVDFPVIVKPNFGDSSIGITQRSVAFELEQLVNAITEIRANVGYDKPILVERYLTGADMTVGIIGNPPENYVVLPIIEEDYSGLPADLPRICGYEAKWMPSSPYACLKSKPAQLPPNTEKFIVSCCLKLFERLECRDYARFDWRLDSEGNPYLLEVNPNPGWCWDGHLAKMAGISFISYAEMVRLILLAAEIRLKLTDVSFGATDLLNAR
ncbi:MAG TPA: methyltransferase domain-containing protein [Candidatus Sumerlaeota bacterium]|nr:MAG: D-alanine--D-alanine ligase B [candidate division BRC1 bacterium ADurb.Bin183]HOE63023.1 methyltransferase domain-containing protein [Candidatus Sumerlaeota bacterium]HRR30692.1 methyltransferase domain-containing protein [Candidatus Sumerlaeia bacterium]HON49549.1 methyltransferase domain-containing protein [Candidatus Sumerlaeota bacterium]HOR64700.1 methyltransferase domain-containing protein [Candidatus Sumerlaeota bacterium]